MAQTKTFARIEHGQVREMFRTDQPMEKMFHPSLVWVDATGTPDVAALWSYDGTHFAPPGASRGDA